MSYTSQTLGDLLTALAARYEGSPFWSADDARRAINEGLRIYNLITGIYRGETDPLTLIPEDEHFRVSGNVIKVTRVWVVGQPRPMTMTSIAALDRVASNWSQLNTQLPNVRVQWPVPSFWAPIGLTEIVIFPRVAQADFLVAPVQVRVSGVVNAPILNSPSDPVNLGLEETSTLLGYALHTLSFAKGAEALAKTKPLLVAFYRACALRSATFAASSLYRQMTGYDRLRAYAPMVESEVERINTTVLQTPAGASNVFGTPTGLTTPGEG